MRNIASQVSQHQSQVMREMLIAVIVTACDRIVELESQVAILRKQNQALALGPGHKKRVSVKAEPRPVRESPWQGETD